MLKRVAPVLLALTLTAAVFGATTKIKSLHAAGPGLTENPDADGMVIFHFNPNKGTTEMNLTVTDFAPNTVYSVVVETDGGGGALMNAITTNASGNGHVRQTFAGDLTQGTQTVTIHVWDGVGDPVDNPNPLFEVTASELRAQGSNP